MQNQSPARPLGAVLHQIQGTYGPIATRTWHTSSGAPGIALQPTTCRYPVSLKILADGQALYRTSAITPGLVLKWNEARAYNVSSISRIEIRVYEHHKYGIKRKQVASMGYILAEIRDLSSILREWTVLVVFPAGQQRNYINNSAAFSVPQESTPGVDLPGQTEPRISASPDYAFVSTASATENESMVRHATEVLSIARGAERQRRLIEKLGPVRTMIDMLLKLGEIVAELDPRAKGAFSLIATAWEELGAQERCDQSLEYLVSGLVDLLPAVGEVQHAARLSSLQGTIKSLWELIVEASQFVRDYKLRGEISQTWQILRGLGPQEEVEKLLVRMRELKDQFDRGIRIQGLQMMDNQSKRMLFNELRPVRGAQYDPERACMPGTRKDILRFVSEWCKKTATSNRSATANENVLWLFGQAGLGKSAITTSICEELNSIHWLAASFFCKRDDPDRRDAHRVLSSIIFGLASHHPAYAAAVRNVLENDPTVCSSSIRNLFTKLIQEILKLPYIAHSDTQHVIVIDGLDECEPREDRQTILELLLRTSELVSWLKLIVTSRPSPDIQEVFRRHGRARFAAQDLSEYDASVDILAFIKHNFTQSPHASLFPADEANEPNSVNLSYAATILSQKAAGLFIWARTACEFILNDYDPPGVVRSITNGGDSVNPVRSLDELYTKAVQASITRQQGSDHHRAKTVVQQCLSAIVVCSRRAPLSVPAMSQLFGDQMTEHILRLVVDHLKSLLYIDKFNGETVRVYHASFVDYILDPERSGELNIDLRVKELNSYLADHCLEIMVKELRFNVCNIESSYKRNREIDGLEQRIQQMIKPHWIYSCTYWADYILDVPGTPNLELFETFLLGPCMLYWIETLSLLGRFDIGLSRIQDLLNHFSLRQDISSPVAELKDILRFMQTFSIPIRESAPHVYVSGLAFIPSRSLMKRVHAKHFQGGLIIKKGAISDWSNWSQSMAHEGSIHAVSFSPDGRRVISGSSDRTVRVWDAATGALVGDPLAGHSSLVRSVAFSPDGHRIVSGSSDKTVRVWNASTGVAIGKPFIGHSDVVSSVALSPDSQRIASGSWDKTVRIWDAHSGVPIGEPFTGHLRSVNCVSFSPDGLRVVSGSDDKTVRVWDAATGHPVFGPLTWHSSVVSSVAFSPDGQRIISGSSDNTLRVWEADTGVAFSKPLAIHSDSIHCVVFSPDGRLVAFGSYDNTVQVCDAVTGASVCKPLSGHSSVVSCVAFSPNGRLIVSGSYDSTVRIWDVDTGVQQLADISLALTDITLSPGGHLLNIVADSPVAQTFAGHSGSVNAVTFSADGRVIISGSDDETVRMWDADTGAPTGQLLAGHLDSVHSVSLSPVGDRIVSGSYDNTVRVWDARSGSLVGKPLLGHSGSVNSVKFSPHGRWIASGSSDSDVRVWNAETGALVIKPISGHVSLVNSVAFSPDGCRLASGSYDRTVRVWDAATGDAIGKPLAGHSASVNAVAFSPDGRLIVSGSSDHTARVWDANVGLPIGVPLAGHSDAVSSVAFSPNGRYVASGSHDNTVRLWDIVVGSALCEPLAGHCSSVNCVAFSPDGHKIVSGSDDNTLRVWDVQTIFSASKQLFCCSTRADSLLSPLASPDIPRSSTVNLADTSTGGDLLEHQPVAARISERFQTPGILQGPGHTPKVYNSNVPHMAATQRTVYTNMSSLIEYCGSDGWVTAPSGDLLFWLPTEYRRAHVDQSLFVISAKSIQQPVWLDMSDFACGPIWASIHVQKD
ncbi:hypothetical protein RhiJN_24798 [Ceratobasidium sp. AG-Ba]|nr:hypothetical protein RhiJN_24798 [Ceratobasidium sp. AG-Ba]